jgi:hypothetical protein
MNNKTSTRRRLAALASGAMVAGGLVVAPAVAGFGAANAAPVAVKYTCAAQSPVGPIELPGTVTIDITSPESVRPGSGFPAGVTATLDFGSLSMGPVTELTGSFDIPLTLGSDTATFTTPAQTAPNTALVYTGSGTTDLTAPTEVGSAPVTMGTIIANFAALGMPITGTCTPDEGEDTTVGSVTVSEDAPVTESVAVTGKVKVTGKAKVGKTLKAKPGKADGATVTYQWLANGKAIKNATKSKLKLTKGLKGKKVSVQATYGKDGYLDTVQTSKAVKVKK